MNAGGETIVDMIAACDSTVRLDLTTTLGYAGHLERHGALPTPDPRRGSAPGALVEESAQAGLRGRGGGWFPTHLKMRAVVESSSGRGRIGARRRPLVVGNGMEGEPASGKDAALLAAQPHLVIDGLVLAAEAVGAPEAVLAVHRGSPVARSLQIALDQRAATQPDRVPVRLVIPPARYVASEESALSHWIGEGLATPVYPDRPFQRGVSGRPTLVQNVETLAHLALIARHGAAWFASVGTPSAPGTTLVTVGGAVAMPGVLEVATGTPVDEILRRCGGTTDGVRGYLTGGYGGAWVSADSLTPAAWDPDSVRVAGGVIGAGVLWVLGNAVCPVHEMARVTSWMAGESAGQCGPCLFGLPAVADDVMALAIHESSAPRMRRLETRLGLVTGRGGCKHPDGTSRFVATGLAAFASEVDLHLQGMCTASGQARGSQGLPVPPLRDAIADHDRKDLR